MYSVMKIFHFKKRNCSSQCLPVSSWVTSECYFLEYFMPRHFLGKSSLSIPFLGWISVINAACIPQEAVGVKAFFFINLRKWQDRSYLSAAMLGWTGGLWTVWRGAPELCSHAGLSLPRKQLWTFLAPGLVVSAVLCSSVASSPSWSPRV